MPVRRFMGMRPARAVAITPGDSSAFATAAWPTSLARGGAQDPAANGFLRFGTERGMHETVMGTDVNAVMSARRYVGRLPPRRAVKTGMGCRDIPAVNCAKLNALRLVSMGPSARLVGPSELIHITCNRPRPVLRHGAANVAMTAAGAHAKWMRGVLHKAPISASRMSAKSRGSAKQATLGRVPTPNGRMG